MAFEAIEYHNFVFKCNCLAFANISLSSLRFLKRFFLLPLAHLKKSLEGSSPLSRKVAYPWHIVTVSSLGAIWYFIKLFYVK